MEFLKKNYEKVLLAVVLLGLTIAACLLPFIIAAKKQNLQDYVAGNKPKVKPIPPLDTAFLDSTIQRAKAPLKLDYTTKHNLFNPVVWKKLSDGRLIKEQTGNEEGPDALVVTAIKPLYLKITYSSQSGTGYMLDIERQSALRESQRSSQTFVSSGSKGGLLSLQGVKGPPEKPTELDLVWNDTAENIVLNPDKPFSRVDAYSADLKYPLEANKIWTDRRVGSQALKFANATYKIVVITESNVVVSAEQTQKKTTITFHPAPEPR